MVVAESATSVKDMVILQNSNMLSDSFAPGFLAWALVSSQVKLRLRSSLKVSRSIRNFILAKF